MSKARVLHRVFIHGDVRSSKNSRRVVKDGGGRVRSIDSAAAKAYTSYTSPEWLRHAAAFRAAASGLPRPLHVVFVFTRATHARFDSGNLAAMLLDCMTGQKLPPASKVAGRWIDDDTAAEVRDICAPGWCVDKHKPGVEILLLDKDPLPDGVEGLPPCYFNAHP